ncbi:hypothetical protein [Marinisporobacter balticus]|uniref:Uncharacterized protein n=1 Tax=Marinisporobacter balticus TaxID=2018667 RepID=A0A4R2K7E5_9FIRM|nr:hypothetical protein [Marinisporobacter balticus]TCO68494.1 hypothetical protein EV214_14416 [Marinisporobacter balticus]
MKRYTKVIRMTGFYFTKEFEKKKHHKNKIRELREETIAKFFLEGDMEIIVYFEESDREILITSSSDPKDIQKYLGNKFIQ